MQDEEDVLTKNVALNLNRENIKVVDGVLIKYKDQKNSDTLKIPNGVIEIAKSSVDAPFVKTICVPRSVKVIRENWTVLAFSLQTLYIENPNVLLEVGCLDRLSNLKEIYIGGQKIDTVVTQGVFGKVCWQR